jgi:prepilin-type N-terminal cleavage/methylation domain-containing protein
MQSRHQAGFSLIEMVITITVALLLVAISVGVAPKLRAMADEAAIQQALDEVVSNVVAAHSTKLTYDGLSRTTAITNGWYPAAAVAGLSLGGVPLNLELAPVDLYAEGRNSSFRVTFPANRVNQFQCRNFLQSQVARIRGIWVNGAVFAGPTRYTGQSLSFLARGYCDPELFNIIGSEWGPIITGN